MSRHTGCGRDPFVKLLVTHINTASSCGGVLKRQAKARRRRSAVRSSRPPAQISRARNSALASCAPPSAASGKADRVTSRAMCSTERTSSPGSVSALSASALTMPASRGTSSRGARSRPESLASCRSRGSRRRAFTAARSSRSAAASPALPAAMRLAVSCTSCVQLEAGARAAILASEGSHCRRPPSISRPAASIAGGGLPRPPSRRTIFCWASTSEAPASASTRAQRAAAMALGGARSDGLRRSSSPALADFRRTARA
mmetsp:Transcript_115132/g.367363  ORF Transcript_115132/g.367363 Transcript_115132/m.367363 type:complete len:259 (+) Transcript_115132:970-1746(+)